MSVARNNALAVATGSYLGFVDSDDWIEPEMYERLMKAIQDYGADIASCGIIVTKNGKDRPQKVKHDLVFNRNEALYELISQKTI